MQIFVELPPPGVNAAGNWHKALKQAIETNADEICFHPGKYEFFPEGCTEKFFYFSNNDQGVKTIALHLNGLKNLTVNGNGTLLFFHGRISPLIAENCENLRISGLTVDFEESFVSEASVTRRENGISWIKIRGKHRFADGKIRFCEDQYDNLSGELFIRPYDPQKGEMPWNADVTVAKNSDLTEQNGEIGIPCDFPGDHVLIKHEERLCPGIVLSDCRNIAVENTIIHHAAGMGLLAQFCTDVAFDGVKVIPNGQRHISASDDAMHMVECRGQLLVSNCVCSGTLDDSLNVHGIYRPIESIDSAGNPILGTGHFQQTGFPGAKPGDTLEFVRSDTGCAYAAIPVKKAAMLSPDRTAVELSGKFPAAWQPGDCVRVLEPGQAVLEVRNCDFTTLRGRGVLASGLNSAAIRNCRFHTTGAAVFIAGGCKTWFETGPVQSALIENNVFENCCYQRFSSTRETVSVYPDIDKCPDNFYYHGAIEIRNNRFISQKRPQIAVLSAKEVRISGNCFEFNELYPFDPPQQKIFSFAKKDSPCKIFRHVENVICENDGTSY